MGLKETAVKSTIWKTLENSVSQLLSFAVFLVLARMLNPEAYGVIALAGVFIASLSALSAFGIEQTVIQLEKPLPEYLSSAFYLSGILSVTIYLILALGAAAISRLFSVPQLENILPWLGLSVILNSLCAVPRGILTRNFMFKYLALRSITAITIGGVAGIWMALVGYNEWALVGQQLAMAASSTIILFASCRWFPTVRFSWRYISDTLSFSLNVLGSQLTGTATRQADNLLIGVFLGSTALGIYSIGYKIFDTATQVILDSMSSIAFPAFSRVQGDLEKMREVYYSIVISSTAITIPCFIMLILLSEPLVPAVFGEQWRGSGPVLQYLMIAACISSITFFNSSLLLALGRARAIFKLGLLNTSLNIIAFLIAVRWGIVAVAAAFAIRAIVTFPVSMYLLNRYTSITFTSLIVRMKGHCAALLCLLLAVTIAGDRTNDLSVWLRLLAQISIGGIAYITTLYLFDRALCKQLFSLVIAATKRP